MGWLCGWSIMPLTTSSSVRLVGGGEDVEPAVVVEVERPAREAVDRPVDAHFAGDVREGAVAVVAKQPGGAAAVSIDVHEQIGVAVVVEVDPRSAQAAGQVGRRPARAATSSKVPSPLLR